MSFSVCRLLKSQGILSGLNTFKQYQSLWKNQHMRKWSHLEYKSTIYAVSSGYGKCGVAVIRLSGPETLNVIKSMACHPNLKIPKPRYASLRNIVHPESKEILDEGLCLWFPKPHSFTGEDCAEFQVHGSLAVLSAILASLSSRHGLRPAEPGEFARRAFMHGRLDLTQVEAMGDLIAAETEAQRVRALGQMKGDLKRLYEEWRKEIIECLASVEAYIDFSEDEIIEDNILETVKARIEKIHASIQNHIEVSNKCGVRIRSGIKSVIVGEPNVGKSSLMNLLCQKQTSIVTPTPGTTRDVIERHLDLGGYPVVLLDTAGLRLSTADPVETQGIARARCELSASDLTLILVAFSDHLVRDFSSHLRSYINDVLDMKLDVDRVLIRKSSQEDNSPRLEDKRYLIVINKIDLATPALSNQLAQLLEGYDNVVAVSCLQGTHVDLLLDSMTSQLKMLCGSLSSPPLSFTQARHYHHLTAAGRHLAAYLALSGGGAGLRLSVAAQELRLGARALGSVSGAVRLEEVLDVIFGQFCIGK